MASNWPRVRVSDVCELIVDCVNKTAPVSPVPTPYKMIRTPNIKNGRVSTDDCRCVDADTFAKWTRRATVERNDVLLTREAPLGEVGIVNSSEQLFLGQRIMQYRADQSKLEPHFLLYSFLTPDLQHQFSMHEGSGSVVSHIRVGDCSKFELNLPPLAMQKRISEILRNLDNKITLNHQINQTLEQMAQTLFKSWFVDFDPVIDNALDAGNPIPDELQHRAEARKVVRESEGFKPLPEDVRQLFPDAFEESELGWVPKGWEQKSVSDALTVNPKVKLSKGQSAHFVDMKALPTSGYSIEEVTQKAFSGGAKFEQNDVLLARITPCLQNGKTGFVDFLGEGEVGFGSTEFIVLRGDKDVHHTYIACLARHEKFRQHAMQSMVGSSGRQRVQNSCFDDYFIAVPTDDVMKKFAQMTKPSFDKFKANTAESIALAELRDTLLPKLISGELRLDEIEAAVE
ncbi:restriction endonuclease subunit S [Vibrio cholerae]|uniref:restriction endonuclease subunit S n=1 Tax=Vibrio cholerae TaxID=666 RepID=UPI00115EF282|nr:restriction endonuclease subunit S [Vibrio cholerae]TQP31306.1 restriction endonuclease subunit S [Vibrio cholerae]